MSTPYASPFTNDEPEKAEWREVVIAGVAIPVLDDFDVLQLARWAPKQTTGDFTLESDDMISALVISERQGGGQVERHTSSSEQRFWDSTGVETMYPGLLSLSRRYEATTGPNSNPAMPIGDYPGRDLFYGSFGTTLCSWNETTRVWTAIDDLTAIPNNKGIEYKGLLYIPLASSGLAIYNPVGTPSVVTVNTTIEAIDLCLWDDKLLALTAGGALLLYDGTAWSSPVSAMTLPTSRIPRHLVVFHNDSGDPAVYIATDEDVWVYDPLIPKLYRTGVIYPPHPDMALAAGVWRNTDMYISVGIGVHGFTGSVQTAVGLDRNDGLPAELRGAIVDFYPEYNGMLALVRGAYSEGTATTPFDVQEPQITDDPAIFPARRTVSTLWRFTGGSWYKLWQSSDASGIPTKVFVSVADGAYTIWWGYAGKMYRMPIPRAFTNPEQGLIAGTDEFTPTGMIDSGWYDHQMTGFSKLASHVVVMTKDTFSGTYEVRYRTDTHGSTLLGTVTAPGVYFFPYDPDGDGFSEGDAYHKIRFEERLIQTTAATVEYPDPAKTSPMIEALVHKYIKLPKSNYSFVLTVPLDFPDTWKGRGPGEIATFLDGLSSDVNPRFHKLQIGDEEYRVRVAQVQGKGKTGADTRSLRRLNIVSVPQAG